MANESLNKAKVEKNDEFYTLMEDIENELSRYDFSQFKDKIVYCNCDDPTWSNFFKFFTGCLLLTKKCDDFFTVD